jgi:ABC-type sugar transport system substrate-binding protein
MESQGRRLATVIIAPLLGLAVGAAAAQGELARFWPVGAVGGLVALGFFTRSGLSSTR